MDIKGKSMKYINDWLAIARRFDKVVDFGSPVSAWSADMLKANRLANGDIPSAIKILKGLSNENKQ